MLEYFFDYGMSVKVLVKIFTNFLYPISMPNYYYSITLRIKLKLNVNENIYKYVRYTTKIKYRFKRVLYIFLFVRKVFIAKKA
jgi:hypothetical protein